ncbi:MAG: adenylate/guanylate cyclase domain-containing protein [Ahrensia sp.]|nr:adenylate/guanylate cyclase domain-containing protein [Ahrensia sp.]
MNGIAKLFNDQHLSALRLYSGLVLMVYVTTHLINHSIGLITLEAMQAANDVVSPLWRFLPVSILLYGALIVHFIAAFWKLLKRRTTRMSAVEAVQIALGFAVPLLLATHVMGTRYANAVYGINDTYLAVLVSAFIFSPVVAVLDALGLLAAWAHGCIGMHQWLKLKSWYTRTVYEWCLSGAILLPTLALGSFLFNGRAMIPLASDGEFLGAYFESLGVTDDAVFAALGERIDQVRWGFLATVFAGVAGRLIWQLSGKRSLSVEVSYQNGPKIRQKPGPTLLEMSKMAAIPHASVCGGRGRCSTCRVHLLEGGDTLEPPSDSERRVLERFNAAESVRLACQIRPTHDLSVLRLLPPDATMERASSSTWASGQERVITVMFADLRNFTGTTEHRLPFDVVYLVNQFSQAMGQAVEARGGRIDKFLGDGFMALFGVETTPEKGALQAIEAAAAMQEELDALNNTLTVELDQPLRMGVGIHCGSVVLGDMGYGEARGLTAIGDTVNTASRLESATKDHGCAICVSQKTIEMAGLRPDRASLKTASVRGKTDTVSIAAIERATDLLQSNRSEDGPREEMAK